MGRLLRKADPAQHALHQITHLPFVPAEIRGNVDSPPLRQNPAALSLQKNLSASF
jgi:hypothetical protein